MVSPQDVPDTCSIRNQYLSVWESGETDHRSIFVFRPLFRRLDPKSGRSELRRYLRDEVEEKPELVEWMF